jgi:aspartokinase
LKIGGLVEQGNLVMYTITSLADQPGVAGDVLIILANADINLEYITEISYKDNSAVMSFCIDADWVDKADTLIQQTVEAKSLNITKIEYVTTIGIYGPHFREKPGIAAAFCSILGEAGINILGISSSISTISCIIDIRDIERAKELLLRRFELP